MDELLDGGIDGAADALRRGTVSSRELVGAALARIAARNAELGAFLRVDDEAALRRADAFDRARADGRLHGSFGGIPLARKDLFDRAGETASCGARRADASPATETASCLQRLDDAGFIDLGPLNMSEHAFHPHGLNALLGPPRNPWDLERTGGGSSGGSAVAVAARLVFGSMGSDSGGSVRHPAALCGVVGLLPTRGTISRFGMMRSSPSLNAAGPIARTARDCALLCAAAAGPDGRDAAADIGAIPFWRKDAALRGAIVARPLERQLVSVSGAVRGAYEAAAEAMRGAGAEFVEIALPDWDELNALTAIVFASEVAATHRERLAADPGAYSPEVRERIAAGFVYPAADYLDALRIRARMTRRFVDAVFARAQALLLPAATDVAPRLDEVMPGSARRRYDAGAFTLATPADPGRFMRAFNYLGLPALALPAGFSPGGLPLGIQLVGRPRAEYGLFALGEAFQGVTGHHEHRPPMPIRHRRGP